MQWPRRRNRLHYWRKIRNYTQEELGRKIGISPSMISQWERDYGPPSNEHAFKLARILRVSVKELWPYERYYEKPEGTRKELGHEE